MNATLPFALALSSLALVGNAATRIEMLVVAEHSDEGAAHVQPTADRPATYAALDGGDVDGGDPIGLEKRPDAGVVARALQASLAAHGFRMADTGVAPALLLTYHWGSLRPSSYRQSGSWEVDPNLKARLALVATVKDVSTIESYLLKNKYGAKTDPNYPAPSFLTMDQRTLFDAARDERYFAIVSAYDFASVEHRQAKLLWRVKLSTRAHGLRLHTTVPTLITEGGRFFGTNLGEPELVSFSPAALDQLQSSSNLPDLSAGSRTRLDSGFVNNLIQHEHSLFSGERTTPAPTEKKMDSKSDNSPRMAAQFETPGLIGR